MNDYEKMI